MKQEPIKALLVEDDRTFAYALGETLAAAAGAELQLAHVERLDAGLRYLAATGADVVLLDQTLPDSTGLETVRRIHAAAPDTPIVVITGHADEGLAVQALREGAQDYLLKGAIDGRLLVQAIRYAIERAEAGDAQHQARELQTLERLSSQPQDTVTARIYGESPLRVAHPETFSALTDRYEQLLERALEQRIYKVTHPVAEGLRAMAEELGYMRAGPRDVIDIYATVMERKGRALRPQKVQPYVEEGRLLVVELLGHLVTYYRQRSARQ